MDPLSLPRNDAYLEANDDMLDVPGLSKIKPILNKYKLRHVSIDFKLRMTVKGHIGYRAAREIEDNAISEMKKISGLNGIKDILYKYNLTYVQITDELDFSTKRMKSFCPLKNS